MQRKVNMMKILYIFIKIIEKVEREGEQMKNKIISKPLQLCLKLMEYKCKCHTTTKVKKNTQISFFTPYLKRKVVEVC